VSSVHVRGVLAGDDGEAEAGAAGRGDRVDEWLDDLDGERGDDQSEGDPDDHGDREVDDVAPQQEVLEAFDQRELLSTGLTGQ
jgi:hypothetical protein